MVELLDDAPKMTEPEQDAWMDLHRHPALLMAGLEPTYKIPPHVQAISQAIGAVAAGGARIIIETSVRHGKSWLSSWATPVWYLDLFPHHSIALGTYQANFSATWGRRVRNTVLRHPDKLNVRVAGDSAAAHSWNTTMGGGLHTAGVGGEFTGRGFHLVVIDDPIKNHEEAYSKVYRDKVWNWWQSTIYTRLEPNASVIITMARWHHDDLIGRLKDDSDSDDEWDVIRLPAIAEKDDLMDRAPGQSLWPDRYDEDRLKKIRSAVGSKTWESLYQQRPSPEEGDIFKREWIRYYTEADDWYVCIDPEGRMKKVRKDHCWRFCVADTAMKENDHADYTVRMVFDVERVETTTSMNDLEAPMPIVRGGRMFLVDVWREQTTTPTMVRVFTNDFIRHRPLFFGVEDKVSGTSVIQIMREKGLPVRGIKAVGDKVTRAVGASAYMEAGMIFFPRKARFLDALESELLCFPEGQHDDQVDCLSHGCAEVLRSDKWIPAGPKPAKPGTIGEIIEDGPNQKDDWKQQRKKVWR